MPLYDCGSPDCDECQQAFGPDRSVAIARFKRRAETICADLERDQERWGGQPAAGEQP